MVSLGDQLVTPLTANATTLTFTTPPISGSGYRSLVITANGMSTVGMFLYLSQPVSRAEGQFMNTSVIQANVVDPYAALSPSIAVNYGNVSSVVSNVPINATALGQLNFAVPSLTLPGNQSFFRVGAANQYARADNPPYSVAASGAVDDQGLIDTEQTDYPADSSINFTSLLTTPNLTAIGLTPDDLAALSQLNLAIGSMAATARSDLLGLQTGNYTIDGMNLTLVSPGLIQALVEIESNLTALTGSVMSNLTSSLINGTLTLLESVLNGLALGALANANHHSTIKLDL
jgi:hypothetical protein